jgi:hypothetical protein
MEIFERFFSQNCAQCVRASCVPVCVCLSVLCVVWLCWFACGRRVLRGQRLLFPLVSLRRQRARARQSKAEGKGTHGRRNGKHTHRCNGGVHALCSVPVSRVHRRAVLRRLLLLLFVGVCPAAGPPLPGTLLLQGPSTSAGTHRGWMLCVTPHPYVRETAVSVCGFCVPPRPHLCLVLFSCVPLFPPLPSLPAAASAQFPC